MKKLRVWIRLIATAGFAITLWAGSVLLAQEEPAAIFGEVIDVRVVNVEAVVTDREGQRITGLGPEDFRLLVDGAEVPITYFTEISDGRAVPRRGSGSIAQVPAASGEGPVGTSFLVFIDDYLSIQRDRDKAIDRLVEQLPVLGEADRMAVVAFDGGKLEMLSNWSPSIPEIRHTLEAAKQRSAKGLQRELLVRRPRQGLDMGRIEREMTSRQLSDQMKRVILASTAALRSFADPPGRKTMLLLAGGWPYDPRALVMANPWCFGSLYTNPRDRGAALYQPLYDTANRLGYTIYTVDLPGFRGSSGVSAEHRSANQARYASQLNSNRESTENSTLMMLADQTGGRAFLNASARGALEEAVRDTRSYYWLGFSPTWRGVDRRHRLRLQLRDPSLEVRTRRSFSDLSRDTEVSMMVESALLFGDVPGAGNLQARLGDVQNAGFRRIEVPIEIIIPLHDLTFLPSARGVTTRVELRVAVEDKHGDRSDVAVVPLSLDYPRQPAPGDLGRYVGQIKMRRLKHDLVVSIYDELSGKMLWTHLELEP